MSLDRIAGALLTGVLNSFSVMAGLTLMAWLLAKVLPRTNAATRYLLWWAVLALFLLIPFGFLKQRAAPRPARIFAALPATEAAPRAVGPVGPRVEPAFPVRLKVDGLPRLLLIVWSLFCIVHLSRLAWSFLYIQRVKRKSRPAPQEVSVSFHRWVTLCGIRRRVQLLVSDRIASPLATGFLRPAVILPEVLLGQVHDQELDHVFLHELAHVARRDDWTNLAARLFGALVGLHPVAAWVLRQVERERELACDDWVVAMTGEARPYAASLVRLSEICGAQRRMMLATGMAESGSHLGERIEILLRRSGQFTASASLLRVAAAGLVLMALLGVGMRAPRWIVLAQAPGPTRAYRPRSAAPANPRGSFLSALVAAGYGDLPVEDIIAMKDHGVGAEFLAGIGESGWGRLSAKEIIDLHANGVSLKYLTHVHEAGFRTVTIRDAINLHAHGVNAESIAEIHRLGFGPYSPDQAIELASHGVSPEFFSALLDAGVKSVEPSAAIQAFSRGVGPRTLRSAGQYGSHLTLSQIVKLKESGVIP